MKTFTLTDYSEQLAKEFIKKQSKKHTKKRAFAEIEENCTPSSSFVYIFQETGVGPEKKIKDLITGEICSLYDEDDPENR